MVVLGSIKKDHFRLKEKSSDFKTQSCILLNQESLLLNQYYQSSD